MLASNASPRDDAWFEFREPTCFSIPLKTIGHDVDAESFANTIKDTHCLNNANHKACCGM